MKAKPHAIPIVVIVGLSAGIVASLVIAANRDLTASESLLLAILLSAASMMVSWLVTHLYSQANLDETIEQATATHTENVRNYARKAAEKVLNLSNELERLTAALNSALEDGDELPGYKDSSVLYQERISAAIHSLETLRSMNDTFLSDWRGVIGEEIDRQHALEAQIAEISAELLEQQVRRSELESQLVSPEDLASVRAKIEETERRLNEKMADLPFRIPAKTTKPRKRECAVDCPECGQENSIMLRDSKRAQKLFQCRDCGSYVSVRQHDGTREVAKVPMHEFEVSCPVCKGSFFDELPDYPSALKRIDCPSCEFPLILARRPDGVNVKVQGGNRRQLKPEFVDRVLSMLPPRPWPKGIHKTIATDLGTSNNMVTRAIEGLMRENRVEHGGVDSTGAPNGHHETIEAQPDGSPI